MGKKQIGTFQSGIFPKGTYQLTDLIAIIKQDPNFNECGAIMTFTGIVRGLSQKEGIGNPVKGMHVEANIALANQALQKICSDLEQGDVKRVIICHSEGEFATGEDLVYVIIAGGHRQATFAALQQAIERYKSTAAIWKKEILTDGKEQWIH